MLIGDVGPVGKLLKRLNRHPYRPSHMHFMIIAEGFDTLVTALYVRGDPFETSDAVFGVKSSLLIDVKTVPDEEMAKKYGVSKGDWLIEWDFVCPLSLTLFVVAVIGFVMGTQADGRFS